MDDGSGKDNSDAKSGDAQGQPGVEHMSSTRRTFSRAALTSSGVLLTLGNSAAWGETSSGGKKDKGKKDEKVCVSAMILESFVLSSHFEHHKKDKKFNHYMSHVDLNGDPEDGYTVSLEGRNACMTGPKHP
ncbi:hypothetical protein EYC98_08785 [Halieaceae bacterium IMCC14734]|uniref:Uncharacterized protein n=1 Tax=Candidatus Litorirhabdus singularis TaxID=2518993 RepID=A0ABT3THU5_9GAMM|nr:hypothetical protein [Candidatus Litorirhabdus singularis]MCX2980957.1 hypothetical protein [Candidatus Litorirhabdus singularis]